jgi:hypothetical protein
MIGYVERETGVEIYKQTVSVYKHLTSLGEGDKIHLSDGGS